MWGKKRADPVSGPSGHHPWLTISSKSQLAIEYAHRVAVEKTDEWIFWVHAGTQARVQEGFRAIADAVKLPGRKQPKADIPQLVHSWLSDERNGRWFMVLDSADDGAVFYGVGGPASDNNKPLASYLPRSRNGSILVTTRDKELARRAGRGRQEYARSRVDGAGRSSFCP